MAATLLVCTFPGLSLSQVGSAMGVSHHSIQRWELTQAPIASERAQCWDDALAALAAHRALSLAGQGFSKQDLPRDLRRAIATLQGR